MKSRPTLSVLGFILILGFGLTACSPGQPTSVPTLLPTAVMELPSQAPTQPVEQSPVTETPPQSTQTQPVSPVPSLTSVTAFPDPAQFDWVQVADGLTRPTAMADPNDGSGILLVLEQPGTIRLIQDGVLSAELFMDLTGRVGSGGNEQGLLGIALDPDYAQNGLFYLNYTDKNGDTVVARYHRMPDSIHGDPNSEEVVLKIAQPYANHNGGDLKFGPDGYLYIGMGDGGSGGDPQGNAQNPDTLLGKMLRIAPGDSNGYSIPPDNPYASVGGRQEIWALGLRNPWRFSFDRLTGDLFIADVGQNKYEEVNFLPAGSPPGANFGWNYREGKHDYEGSVPDGINLIEPIFDYEHGQGCSVTGGYVYRGQTLPEFYGVYLLTDYCTGYIWGLLPDVNDQWQSSLLFEFSGNVSSFGQDAAGELYLMDQAGGGLYRLSRK